uniref:Uncharacterized protein n=1 Tax=viral metagenome TaxID=1070528 RepID=A0A6M3LZ34_9ZZZZ
MSTQAGRLPWRLVSDGTSGTSDVVLEFVPAGTSVEDLPPVTYFDDLVIPKPKRKKTRKPSWIEKQQKRI